MGSEVMCGKNKVHFLESSENAKKSMVTTRLTTDEIVDPSFIMQK